MYNGADAWCICSVHNARACLTPVNSRFLFYRLHKLHHLGHMCLQGLCSLTDSQAYQGLSHNFGIVLRSKWDGIYALLAIVFVWRCLHAAVLYMRVRLLW